MQQEPSKIAPQSEIKLHYSISLEDGTEVVSTYGEEPFVCRIGDDTLAERLELCLIGMTEGDDAVFVLSGDEVFGPATEDNVQSIDLNTFSPEIPVSTGQLVAFMTPGGDEVAGTILSLNGLEAVVDFNHPLCGRLITFKVTILKVVNPTL
jgi:FKBP-type peptidyl-prolyl cis-trans isomerase SlpA